MNRLVKSEPRLLYYDGSFLPEALRQERVTEDEVRSVVWEQGIAAMEDVRAVELETRGTINAAEEVRDAFLRTAIGSS